MALLTSLHGVSGNETAVISWLCARFEPLVERVTVDPLGNLFGTRPGPPGTPHLVVSAHADEIGLVVSALDPDGFLHLEDFTGVQPRLLEGRQVRVGPSPGVVGVIGARTPQGRTSDEWARGARLEELYVDVGVESAAEVAALGIRVGDPIVVVSELQAVGTTLGRGQGPRQPSWMSGAASPLATIAEPRGALQPYCVGDCAGRGRVTRRKSSVCSAPAGSGARG